MALNVSDAVNQIYQQLNLIGQQIDDSDCFMYLTNAVNYFSTQYSFPTSKKIYNTLFFSGVRDIELPDDFGTLIEPKRPPALWSPRFMMQTDREMSHWPYGRKMAVQYDGATPYLSVVDNDDSGSFLLASCDDTDDTTISGDGSGLTESNMIFTQGTGSLRFTITAGTGQTVITFTGISAFDITEMLTRDWAFCDLILPSTNTVAFTNMKMRLGSSATDYYEMTATTAYRGNTILNGITQVGFDLSTRTETGSVTDTAIDYMQIILNTGLVGVNGVYYLDNIFLASGAYFQVPYYSKYNILAGGTTPAGSVTALTDVILLPVQCDEAIVYKTLELITASPNVANEAFANYAARELQKKEMLLMSLYPSERSLVQSQWYKKTNFKIRNWWNWR